MKKILIIPFGIFLVFVMTGNVSSEECVTPYDGIQIESDTIFCTGNYILPNGITIIENHVSLDCNGSIIDSDVLEPWWYPGMNGISASHLNNITIRNCGIYRYHEGILLDSVNYTFIINNEIFLNYCMKLLDNLLAIQFKHLILRKIT